MITFVLVDTIINQDVRVLTNNAMVSLKTFSIRADIKDFPVQSIRFGLDNNPNFRIENQPPFSLVGDRAGIYRPWKPTPGQHTISVTPYTGPNGTGRAGNTEMITFTVVKPGAVLSKVKEPTSQPELPFLSDFETGSLEGWSKELCCDTSAQVITNPVRTGHYAVQFSLNQTDKDIQGSKRAELTLGKLITPANAERWYGFSIYLPASYVPDLSSEIVAQWHEVPDFTLGENWRTPPLALKTVDGRWQISNRWDPNPLTKKNTPGPGGGQANTPLEPYTTNQWTDWVFHIKWSSEANGLLEVWQDRRLVLRKVGPNTYNDQTGPYFKIGLYKPDWKYRPAQSVTTNRQIIFDEIRVGDQTANFAPPNPP